MPRAAVCADVIAGVQRVSAEHPDQTVFVGIDGFGAAGKSTLAAAVASALSTVTVVHVDDFWGPNIAEWDWTRFRAQVLMPLLDGRTARYQVWDWDEDAPGEWCDVEPGGIVVVEGVSSTRQEAGVDWALTVWVDAPVETRRERALARDGDQIWTTRWVADWIPSEQAYAAREHPRERADLLVSAVA